MKQSFNKQYPTLLETALEKKRKETEKTFLKEWNIDQFKKMEKAIAGHFSMVDIHTATTRYVVPNFHSIKKRFESVGDILGLAYTSSSSYAGYWVCNIEAVNFKYPGYHYVGFAMDDKNKCFAILWDKDENEIIISL